MSRKNLKEGLTLLIDELVNKGMSLDQARREFERQFIVSAIRSQRGNMSRSADAMGMHRNTLRNKVCQLGIQPDELLSRPPRRPARG